MFIVKNSPVTSQANASKSTTEPLNQSFILVTTTNPTAEPTNTSTGKPFTNIISTGPGNAPPVKYILIPSQKTVQNPNTGQTANISMNSGVKTITFNPMPSGASSLHNLPAGTSFFPVNPRPMIRPTSTKITVPITSPNKINFVVPTTNQFAPKVQAPFAITNLPNKDLDKEKSTISNTNSEQSAPTSGSKSPKNSEANNNTSSINLTSKSETGLTKTLITYSKQSPTLVVETPSPTITQEQVMSGSERNDPASNLSGQSTSKNGMQFSSATPNATNRKRKADLNDVKKGSLLALKKSKDDNQTNSTQCTEKQSNDGVTKVRKVIASRNIQTSDKAIINTAAHELKKLLARRELLLKQLGSSCISLGKVEYKLTISGTPIDIQEMYSRIASFQKQFEEDLKRLDWAVSAMHKLYSELAPKDEMRSTEEILKDLMEPAEGVPDDPQSKYDRFRTSPTKSISRSRPRIRTPRKAVKKYYYEGEEGCPESSFEDRVIPDKDPDDGKFHCELCSKVFLKQISLAKHLEFDHPVSLGLEKKINVSRSRSPKRAHCCTDCNKSFHSNIMLLIHRSNEHDVNDSYELSRESRTYSKRLSDFKSKLNDEQETSETSNKANKYGRAKRRTLMNDSKKYPKYEDEIFLPKSMMDNSRSNSCESSVRSYWRDADLFDPDIPIECTDENPIILLKPLSKQVIDTYVKR